MASKGHSQRDFVLDCCNAMTSKMKKYESSKDIYLAGYFALKNKRNHRQRQNSKMFNSNRPRGEGADAYLNTPRNLKQSHSSGSLPSQLRPSVHPLSSDEFKSLIQQYRKV